MQTTTRHTLCCKRTSWPESQSQNGSDGDNGNGGNGNGGNGNGNHGDGGNNGNGNPNENGRGSMPVARVCTYQDFVKCQPLNFKGTEGVVGLTRWYEKIETVFHISNCLEVYQVKYATCTLLDSALTWWNSHKRIIGVDVAFAMTWRDLMKLMTEVYCLRNEIQKMETELWNLTVKNNDLAAYTQRFQELTMLCTRMVPGEEDRIERICGKIGHLTRDCKPAVPAAVNQRASVVNQRSATCFKCGRQGNFKKDCPKLKNQNHGNKPDIPEARGKAYAIGEGDATPGSNVVMGTFLLNNHYASVLFDLGADRSFVSTTFSTLLDIIPDTLDVSYAVKFADERILKQILYLEVVP
ncbi:putative reverse transcriptase domain-containing protein [Tanacetum coccineum]